jgi:4-hydroxy-2-oxoheptanedioate aldolase
MFFKQRLDGTEILRGVINAIPSAVVTQAIAAAGMDLVMIDREHGPIDRESMQAMIAASAGTECAAFVRVPAIDEAEVKAALDAGAQGIVYPLVRTADDAERCVSYMRYPPAGVRGWGPFVAHSRFQTSLRDYPPEVAPQLTCCLLIETLEAVQHIDAILRVQGVDLVVIAPFDLSTALGSPGRFDALEFMQAVTAVERAAGEHGKPLGAAAFTREQTTSLIQKGYRVLFHGYDILVLKDQISAFKTWS